MSLLVETRQYRYELIRPLLRHPEQGEVLLAWRRAREGGRSLQVQLKRVDPPPGYERRRRAMEEVRLASSLRHPCIARVYGWVPYQGAPHVVSEYVPGCFLATAMDAALLRGGPLSPAFCAYVAAEVARALEHAHRAVDEQGQPLRVVHRGLGPLRVRLGAEGQVKLTDFGQAWSTLAQRVETRQGVVRGELAYAAPEVLQGRGAQARSDLYSLGLVLLEMLVGYYPLDPPEAEVVVAGREERLRAERPVWATVAELAERQRRLVPAVVERVGEAVPRPLSWLVERLLRQEPEERPGSAREVVLELSEWLAGQGYGAGELARELAEVLEEAARGRRVAYTVEQGVLPGPEEERREEGRPW